MSAEKVAEAFRILGVRGNQRRQLAEVLMTLRNNDKLVTLAELATLSSIKRTKIYRITEPLRDLDILQATLPIEPKDWRIIYGPKQLNRKRREYGITGPAQYQFNQTRLREALIEKAEEASAQILSVLEEAHP